MDGVSDTKAFIGEQFRKRRRSLGLKLRTVCKAAEIHLGFLSQLELGKSWPSVPTLLRLCAALDIPPGSVFPAFRSSQPVTANDL